MKYDEAKLWVAVIERAMKDAVGKNLKLKEEAIKWLNLESFETVCELANLDFQRVKKCFTDRLKVVHKIIFICRRLKKTLKKFFHFFRKNL